MKKKQKLSKPFYKTVCNEYCKPLHLEAKTIPGVSHHSAIVKAFVPPCGRITKNYLSGPKNPRTRTSIPKLLLTTVFPGVSDMRHIAAV